jgi:hypothetical protein
VTPTNTSTPTPTSGFYTYSVKSGTTACDACFASTFYDVYGPLVNGSVLNTGEYVYLDTNLTIPHPNSFIVPFVATQRWHQISGGLGQITSTDPNGCIDGQCPSPTPTPTQSVTPTNTTTPTPTPTPSGAAFDADAEVYLEQVLFAGGTGITATVSGATNTLFTQLKSDGIYSKLEVLYPYLGGVANSTAINALDPSSYFMQWLGGITHDEYGVKGNGTNGYGETGWIQNAETTTGNTSIGLYMVFSGTGTGAIQYDMGSSNANSTFTLNNYQNNANLRAAINAPLTNFVTNMSGETGFYALSRNNGTQVSYLTPSSSATVANNETLPLGSTEVEVMRWPGIGSFSNKTYGTHFIGQGLTLTELEDLGNAITTFNTTIGR